MALNPLVKKCTHDDTYRMRTFDITVTAEQHTGLAPILHYWHGEEDVTQAILQLRLSPQLPSEYIEDYEAFAAMLYPKEQQAIANLSTAISIMPKNLSPKARKLWALLAIIIMFIPIIIAVFILK